MQPSTLLRDIHTTTTTHEEGDIEVYCCTYLKKRVDACEFVCETFKVQ